MLFKMIDYLAKVIQIHSVIGRPKGKEVGIVGRHLHAADVGLAVDHGCGCIIPHAPKPHCPIIASTHKLRRVGL